VGMSYLPDHQIAVLPYLYLYERNYVSLGVSTCAPAPTLLLWQQGDFAGTPEVVEDLGTPRNDVIADDLSWDTPPYPVYPHLVSDGSNVYLTFGTVSGTSEEAQCRYGDLEFYRSAFVETAAAFGSEHLAGQSASVLH